LLKKIEKGETIEGEANVEVDKTEGGSMEQDGAGSYSLENESRGKQYDFYKVKDGKLVKQAYEPGLEDDPHAVGIPKGATAEAHIKAKGLLTQREVIGKGWTAKANDPVLRELVNKELALKNSKI
jgi:hypothetical protein